MFRNFATVTVELNTATGTVFSGEAGAVELRTTDGVIAINPQAESYLNLTRTTQITLRIGTEFLGFVLENAAASLRDGQLTVLAENIQPIPAELVPTTPRNGASVP